MSAAATPKGERRRARLVESAAEIFVTLGADAVRHRAVADRAGLPLASTTYYFGSLDDLLVAAAERVSADDLSASAQRCQTLARRRRGCGATAEALADVFVGPPEGLAKLASRYELILLAARSERLREVVCARTLQLADQHVDVLGRCGRLGDQPAVGRLIAVEDGAVLAALARDVGAASAGVREALTDVLDLLAPASDQFCDLPG